MYLTQLTEMINVDNEWDTVIDVFRVVNAPVY